MSNPPSPEVPNPEDLLQHIEVELERKWQELVNDLGFPPEYVIDRLMQLIGKRVIELHGCTHGLQILLNFISNIVEVGPIFERLAHASKNNPEGYH